jgi:hypothetical protein
LRLLPTLARPASLERAAHPEEFGKASLRVRRRGAQVTMNIKSC